MPRWLVCVLFLLAVPAAAAERVYTFGISPQKSATELAETWSPMLAWLQARSGVQLRFATAISSADFSRNLAAGRYDFCYVNPQQYTVLHQKPGYTAFAREKDRRLKGIVVVNKASGVAALKDLEGATLVFPSPTSFAASELPQAELRKQGVHFIPKYVNSHESVYLNVAKGLYPAGGGIVRTFELADAETRANLKILLTTRDYPPHAIASHPRVAKPVREQLLAAMLKLNDDPVGKELLSVIGFKGIEAAADADWDDIRVLDLPTVE